MPSLLPRWCTSNKRFIIASFLVVHQHGCHTSLEIGWICCGLNFFGLKVLFVLSRKTCTDIFPFSGSAQISLIV